MHTTARAEPSVCRISQLRITPAKSGAAAGGIGQAIIFTNVGQTSCAMSGYPGIAALDAQGIQVAQARRQPSRMLCGARGAGRIPVVSLAPGHVASAKIGGGDASKRSATPCPAYPAFLVTPPGETHSVQMLAGTAGADSPGFQGRVSISVNSVVPGATGDGRFDLNRCRGRCSDLLRTPF